MSGLDISGAPLSLTCKCGAKVPFTIAQAASEATIACPNCGINIHLQDKDGSTKRAISSTDAAVRRLQNSIRSFNLKIKL